VSQPRRWWQDVCRTTGQCSPCRTNWCGKVTRRCWRQPQPQVAEDLSHGLPGPPGRGELAVQDVQVNVVQQQGNDPALRSPGDRPLKAPVHHHARSQPQADQLQHPSIRHPPPHLGQQPFMADLAEEVPDIELRDKAAPRDEPRSEALHRHHSRPPRPEPERARKEVRLENGLKHDLRGLLRHPVANRRNAQQPLAPVRLRDVHAPGWRGTVRALAQVAPELSQQTLNPYTSCTYARVILSTPAAPGWPARGTKPPAGHHPCGHGHTGRGTGAPETAWPQPIASIEVVARSLGPPARYREPAAARDPLRQAAACRGYWTGNPRPCPCAYPLQRRDQSEGPSLPARSAARRSAVLRPPRTPAALQATSPSAYTPGLLPTPPARYLRETTHAR
jgi:hypothetical protein